MVHNSSAQTLTRWIVVSPWRIRDVQFHALAPDTLRELDHQRSGSGWPMAARALHHVEPVFPVTLAPGTWHLAPGASVRLLIRAQDHTVPTTTIEAWSPDAYTRALSWKLVHEAITFTVCLVLVGLLLWTADPVGWLLAGLLASAETFSAALCYLLFTLSSRALLDIGRRGFWAWVLGGINALALLAAIGTLFTDQPLLLRKIVNALGEVVFVVWPTSTLVWPAGRRSGCAPSTWLSMTR